MSVSELLLMIENLDKTYHVQILHFLNEINYLKLNENENGIFVNIGLLNEFHIKELFDLVNNINNNENEFIKFENEKKKYKNIKIK